MGTPGATQAPPWGTMGTPGGTCGPMGPRGRPLGPNVAPGLGVVVRVLLLRQTLGLSTPISGKACSPELWLVRVVRNRRRATIERLVRACVKPGTEVWTDDTSLRENRTSSNAYKHFQH